MEPQQPRSESGVKEESGAVGPTGASPGPAVRKYPKPPALGLRMVLLCLKPEAWAAAARYPSRFTMIPLILAIVIAGVTIGVSDGVRFSQAVTRFAPSFPAMEISSEGVLKAKGELTEPVRFSYFPLRFVVDPTNKTTLDSVDKMSKTVLITDREVVQRGPFGGEVRYPMSSLPSSALPEKGHTAVVDSAAIRGVAGQLGLFFGMLFGIGQLLGDLLWALLIPFFLCPLITLAASLGERGLVLPKRAAYRMAAALLVPLVLFNAAMHAAGYSIMTSLGADGGMLLWFFAGAGLALWTGVMARQMYGPTRRGAQRG